MRRTMLGLGAVGIAAAAMALPATADAAPAGIAPSAGGYTVQRLPVWDGATRSIASAVDATGRWVGGEIDDALGSHPVMWHDGQIIPLDVPLDDVQITAVGGNGFASGYGLAGGASHPFMISGGGYFELPLPAGSTGAMANGLDASGDIVGAAFDAAGNRKAVLWPGNHFGTVRVLPVPAGLQGSAIDASPNGNVAVTADQNLDNQHSYVFDASGRRTELRPVTRGAQAYVQAISDGFAVGFQFDPNTGASTTLRWNLTNHTVRMAARLGFTNAVNAGGVLGGQTDTGSPALVSAGNKLITLPGLGSGAGAVNGLGDDGTAVGFSRDGNVVAAVTWTK
jgi:hypothetical protein